MCAHPSAAFTATAPFTEYKGRRACAWCLRSPCGKLQNTTRIMARAWRWLSAVRRALTRSSCTSAADLDAIKNSTTIYNPITMEEPPEVSAVRAEAAPEELEQEMVAVQKDALSREDLAAITIQAYFRGHLARRAFRALKSLVKLQAVVRGVCVRRQARVAMHCMQALVRLQVRVRARQLLGKSADVEVGA